MTCSQSAGIDDSGCFPPEAGNVAKRQANQGPQSSESDEGPDSSEEVMQRLVSILSAKRQTPQEPQSSESDEGPDSSEEVKKRLVSILSAKRKNRRHARSQESGEDYEDICWSVFLYFRWLRSVGRECRHSVHGLI